MDPVVISTAAPLGQLVASFGWSLVAQVGGAAAAVVGLVAVTRRLLPTLPSWTLPILALVFGALLNGVAEAAQGRPFLPGLVSGVVSGALAAWGKDVHSTVTNAPTPPGGPG